MTDTRQWPASEVDIVRRDFIDAYVARWGCTTKYAEELMQHVEIGTIEREVEQVRTIRNKAEGEGLYSATYYEGFDDALERVMPNE